MTKNVAKPTYNLVLMRHSEILLTYAEAKIDLNELDASVYDAINKVRNRSGMLNVDASGIGNQLKMRQLVRRERKVELAFEGLHQLVFCRAFYQGDQDEMNAIKVDLSSPAKKFNEPDDTIFTFDT